MVLMDIQMPEMDGLQAARAIREYEQAMCRTRVPIVAMTAFAGNEDRQVCIDAGMDDYLTKPIKSAQLLQLLSKLCPSLTGAVSPATGDIPASALLAANVESSEAGLIFVHSELLERLGGRSEMVPRFIELFCKGVVPQLEALTTALATEDADGVRRCAHAIKGASANISALRIQQTAAMMETEAKQGDLAGVPQLLAVLQREYRLFTETVDALGIVVYAG